MARRIIAIAAMDENRVIGFRNRLPWNLPEDLAHFKKLTMGQAVLMGRKTWESLPTKVRPLTGRTNIVLTSTPEAIAPAENVIVWNSLEDGIKKFDGNLWIAGGAEVYRRSLPFWDEVCLTLVHGSHEGDAYFPEFEERFSLVSEERGEKFSVQRYQRL